jgi:molybdopterin-containing oxidoreductase family iron-sulfur binding subunit
MLAALTATVEQSGHTILRQHWQQRHGTAGFEEFWRLSLYNGFAANTAEPLVTATPRPPAQLPVPAASQGIEVAIRPDFSLYDGRYANNAWLQELPRPLTKITWSNAALISPKLAGQLKVQSQSMLRLSRQGRTVEIPVWILPGHPDDSITVHLGYGRLRAGHTGNGFGSNVYPLRTSAQPWNAEVSAQPVEGEEALASTHTHFQMAGRDIVRSATLQEYQQDREFAHAETKAPSPDLTLYPNYGYNGYAWAMQIDINACIGCNACVIACQAENNIPVVGKHEVERGREMHWLRIDRYYEGNLDNPTATWFQPVPCMQCENAPCELVCPVAATVHDSEGINDMVYNRCVGTRYCSNNCPYKVRRFNFFHYAKYQPGSPLIALQNPDVSVRSRGVMEKCTYCIQRINRARIQAEKQNRSIHDGEFTTACAQTCPTQAILFGNLNEPNSQVVRSKGDPRTYGLLEELGTRPRTTYLAGIRNPSPEVEE